MLTPTSPALTKTHHFSKQLCGLYWSAFTALTTVAMGCGPEDVEPGALECETDGQNCEPPSAAEGSPEDGADETGDGGDPQRVCSVFDGDDQLVEGTTVRWHCSGVARSHVKAKLDLDIPDFAIEQSVLDHVENKGINQQSNFGPGYGADFEDGAVIACCEDDYSYPNTPSPDSEDAEHGWACAVDCIDQACRGMPDVIKDWANGEHSPALKTLPLGCPVNPWSTCYYDQLISLANYIAAHHGECVNAFNNVESPPYGYQVFGLGGELDVDAWIAANDPGAGDAWPAITNIVIDGSCGIDHPSEGSGWELPPTDPVPCTDSNDNNDEDPFESGHGGGLRGPDTFVVASGSVELDGPTYMGVDADGLAPMTGAGSVDCETQPCTWASVSRRNDQFYLHDLRILTPSTMTFTSGGSVLRVDDFELHLDHPLDAPLIYAIQGTSTFTFPAGTVKAIASGKLYGVPAHVQAWNTQPITGAVRDGRSDTFDLSVDPMNFEMTDGLGLNWALEAQFDGWVSHRHAPRARFDIRHVGDYAYLDAGASSDGDGDELVFTWFVDGVEIGARPVVRIPWDPQAIHVVSLNVVDSTGRNDWTYQLFQSGL